MMRPSALLLATAVFAGCVVPYGPDGPASPSAPMPAQAASSIGDLTGLEARVLLLLDENEDADRAARLDALRGLLRRSRTWPPEAQRDLVVYLRTLLDIEERFRPERGSEGFQPPAGLAPEHLVEEDALAPVALPVVQERLDADETAALQQEPPGTVEAPPSGTATGPVTEAPERDAQALRREAVEVARQALARRSYQEALAALADLPAEGDEEVAALRREAVNDHVREQRERAGEMFLEVRKRSAIEARRAGYEEVAGMLRALLETYPESSYAPDIARNLRTVEQELASLGAGEP